MNRWIDLPRSTNAQRPLRADHPVGAGVAQILAANCALAARENALRVLWEDPGSAAVWLDCEVPGEPSTVRWNALDADGGYVRCLGPHRVRTVGPRGLPRLEARFTAAVPAGYTGGVVLALAAPGTVPDQRPDTWAHEPITSTSLTAYDLVLPIPESALHPRDCALRASSGQILEGGEAIEVWPWIAAWCSSGSAMSKLEIYGLTVSLVP